jgi:hypothetical protein
VKKEEHERTKTAHLQTVGRALGGGMTAAMTLTGRGGRGRWGLPSAAPPPSSQTDIASLYGEDVKYHRFPSNNNNNNRTNTQIRH